MPTNSAFDAYFKSAAARLSQNKTIAPQSNPWANYKPITPKVTTPLDDAMGVAGNLGQGVLDFLSTGSYAVAGIGERIGESVNKLGQGDFSNVLADITGIGAIQGAVGGVEKKRTWSDNLKDLGTDEGTAAGVGLALDIVLDPAWLIPGGAIGKGITGTARGVGIGSQLNKAGAKLTPETVKGVKEVTEGFAQPGLRNLPKVAGDFGVLKEVLKPTGQKISAASPEGLQNFYQGIKQANIENYSQWSAARAAKKQNYYMFGAFSRKRPEYRAELKNAKFIDEVAADSELGLPTIAARTNLADQAAETVAKIVDDNVKTPTVPDEIKDASAAEDLAVAAVEKVKPTPKAKEAKVAETVIEDIQTASSKRLQKRVLDYVAERGGDVQEIGQTDLPFSVARKYNNNVTDATANKYWAAIYDLEQQGLIKFGKDYANPIMETAVKTVPTNESVYTQSKRELGQYRTEYQKANGFDTTDINYAAIKASEKAPEMARVYDELVSDPTNPAVISAYKKLVEETKKQYEYLTNTLGIKIEYIKGDPYNVKNAKGEMIPDSRLMMEDVLKNKRLQVRDSSIDFVDYPHPILSIEENNLFRAVHDFFGHAASGRGFAVDGEEAAWVSHSSMFSPEARRAMTTETRGQNSYYNFFDPKRKTFAPQKAALFPEEYTLLPAELDLVTGQALTANAFFGRATNVLSEFSDNVLDDLGMVQTPIRGSQLYTQEQLNKVKDMVDEIVLPELYKRDTPEHAAVTAQLQEIIRRLESGLPETVAMMKKPEDYKVLKMLQQTLDTPVDVTPLLENLMQKSGRSLTPPPAFKPTQWEAKKGKPAFTAATLTKYFADDQLLSNPKDLGIAMGQTNVEKAKIYARKGETKQQAYLRYQATIWDDFRARNAHKLDNVSSQEKADWDAKYQQADSELFTETSAGQLVGMGKLPENFNNSVLTGSFNGKVESTLGKMLENMDSMIKANKLDPAIAKFMAYEFKNALADIKNGIKIVLFKDDAELNKFATQLLDTGLVKSFADAKIAVAGKAEELRKLALKPQMRVYVKDRALLRKTSVLGKGQKVPLLERNAAGLPIDKAGNVITEREAMKLQVSNTSGAADNFVGLRGAPIPQMRMVTDTGADFTGRSVGGVKKGAGSAYAEQTGVGAQQLAGIQAVREAIGAINVGIKAKEFLASPEQASLLTNVMTSLGIKVAEDAAPEAVFKQFQKQALPAFNDIIAKIQSAAKSEAITYQARAVFRKTSEENISIMQAIDAIDPGEVQRSVVKFTEDAIGLVDDFCAINYANIGGPKLSATEFLQQVAPGISKGIIYG
ncbi:MAG: hypothetical protein ACOVLB_02405 [Candidatus Nanopelagicus sp.]